MLATDDDDDVVMADDDDEYRATEIPTQLINSYTTDQKENNIMIAKYDESYVDVDNFTEPDVNKSYDYGKLSFPTAIKVHGKHCDLTETKMMKNFPMEYAKQNFNKNVYRELEYKYLKQLHTNICTLRSNTAGPTKRLTEDLRNFPLTHKQNRRYSFPCSQLEEYEAFNDIRAAACSVKLAATDSLNILPKLRFPSESLKNVQFKELATPKVLLKRFPIYFSNPTISKTPRITEYKCLQQLHDDICSLKFHVASSSTASIEYLSKFPLSQRVHMQNRRYTFPCTLLEENEALNDMSSIGPLKCITDLLCEQDVTSDIRKFPLLKSSHTLNRRRSFSYFREVDNEFAINSTCAVKFPVSELTCHNKATFLGSLNNKENVFSQTSYEKSNLCIADLTVFRNASVDAKDFSESLFCQLSFPCISVKVSNDMPKFAKFPIQKLNNISLNPAAIPSNRGHTCRTITLPYQNQNCDHAREIQVQLNQEQLEQTVENSKLLEHSNYYLEQEQHINDAVYLARMAAITNAKNTTESSSSQNNDGDDGDHDYDDDDDDERNISFCVGGESTNVLTSIGPQMNINRRRCCHHNENNELNFFDTVTPSTPPTLENLELLDSYTNFTKERAANPQNIQSPSSPCSDVRDSSSQEVTYPLNVNVSCSERLTTETRSLILEEIAEAASTDLVTLPKYYSNNTEVDTGLIEFSCTASLSARAQTNVQDIRQQGTEIAKSIDEAMTLTEIEESGNINEFGCVLDDNLSQQDIVDIEEQQSNEMKLEMKNTRGSLSSVDAATSARRYIQLKNEENLTNARRPTVNTYGAGVDRSLSEGGTLMKSREIPTRIASAPKESALGSNALRRHSLTGNSGIEHKLQTGNSNVTGLPTDRNTLRGTTLSGNSPITTNSSRRSSLTSSLSRANDTLLGTNLGMDRTSLRGSALSGTAPTVTTPTTISSRKSSFTGSLPRVNDSLVSATVGSSSTNTEPKKYRRAPTKYVPSSEINDVPHSQSLDEMDSVLPARTLLRRQRRMRSQDSYDETPETTVERLNRLRARISGALSEVKGVLKHYSTDAEEANEEAEVASVLKRPNLTTYTPPEVQDLENVAKESTEVTHKTLAQQESAKKEDGPVSFRFVKLVRRRSFFDEEDEDKEKENQADVASATEINKPNDEKAATKHIIENRPEESKDDNKSSCKTKSKNEQETEISENAANTNNAAEELNLSPSKKNEGLPNEMSEDSELQNEMLESKADIENDIGAIKHNTQHISTHKLLKISESPEAKDQVENIEPKVISENSSEITTKLKMKRSTYETAEGQAKRTIRRASIAAVEGSKIEPPIKISIPLDIKKQRRPSDSAAILKKKSIKVKTTAVNEADGESTPKVKLINKVKRPSLKHVNIATQVTSETKTIAMTDDTNSTPASITKNNSSGSGVMQAKNSNKDALKTAAATTAPAAATLATQLVIDDAPLTISQATVAIADSKATKESSVATDSIVPNDNTIGTASLSPLRDSEQSSQLKKSTTENQKFAESLLFETPIIVVGTKKSLEIVPTEKIDQSKTARIYAETVSNKKEDNQQSINQELKTDSIPEKAKDITASTIEKSEISGAVSVLNENKKFINQKVILTSIDTINEQVRTPENQQVSDEILKAPASIASVVNDVITESAESVRDALITTTTSDALLLSPIVEATKAKATSAVTHSSAATGTSEASAIAMPELQVKAAQVFIEPKELVKTKEPFNVTIENAHKKKVVILKKLVRKNSTEKSQSQLNNKIDTVKSLPIIKDKSKKDTVIEATKKSDDGNKSVEIIKKDTKVTDEVAVDEEISATEVEEQNEEVVEESPVPDKKKRKIKKKVIIKRQQRRLSVSESTFFKSPEEEPTTPVEDTVEKPIEYVKVPSDEEQDYEEIPTASKPTKSCMKVREFQVGDLVMYAERYKKTLVRWKRGKVIERITSISYKLEIEGKEVPAHISYIKKYTGRKVSFGGKEYLEIDYEQIAEEEEKARSYSIWNMV